MKNKYDYHTPMAPRHRVKDVDGIYRNKETGKLLKLRNMYFQGMIDGKTEKPFDAYQGIITMEGGPETKKCVIDLHTLDQYEMIFSLK